MTGKKAKILTAIILLTLMLSFAYLGLRMVFFVLAPNPASDKVWASVLIAAETFGFLQSLGYFIHVLKVINVESNVPLKMPEELENYPPIAVLVPSYKEPIPVIYDTLICCYNLTYPNKQLYLLDDTRYDKLWDTPEKVQEYKKSVEELCQKLGVNLFRRKWNGAKAGIINDFMKFVEGKPLEELEFKPYQNLKNLEKPKYMAVFDSDMNPFPTFLEPLASYMEKDPKIAFVQTPQYYSNFELNKVARSAGFQQTVFFEYICEGKSLDYLIFCCGTNVLLRREALNSVGGFDDASVTEDIATSFRLHMDGWKSLYYNKVSAFGLGPEDLGGYFKQQFRWALGTLTLSRTFFPKLIKYYSRSPSNYFWWEYFLSYTHYYIGCVFLLMLTFPVIFLFFSMPTFFLNQNIYFAVFFPYIILSMNMVFITLYNRSMFPTQLITSMLITAITFPVYIRAAIYSLLGINSSFVVTPKDQANSALPLTDLWPQVVVLLITIGAIAWGFERLYFEREPFFGLIANMAWCLYNVVVLSSIFYFNDPDIN